MTTEEDKSAFLSAVNDVKPLKNSNRVDQYNQEVVNKQLKQTIKKVKRKLGDSAEQKQVNLKQELETHLPSVTSFESILYSQKGIRPQEFSKLKRGEFTVQAVLDLHGYIRDDAQERLQTFIADAYHDKLRYVRIIHGKGYNSDEQYPIIKNLVNQELRKLKPVIAFCSTPQRDGGTGAVNVFLKSK